MFVYVALMCSTRILIFDHAIPNILFFVSPVQGMNELLAPIYYVFAGDTSGFTKGANTSYAGYCAAHADGDADAGDIAAAAGDDDGDGVGGDDDGDGVGGAGGDGVGGGGGDADAAYEFAFRENAEADAFFCFCAIMAERRDLFIKRLVSDVSERAYSVNLSSLA
jgi:hypothetical protein